MDDSHVFVSHASADVTLIDALRDLLVVGVGVSQNRLFCTSLESSRIPEGQNFVQFIKSRIQAPALVIMVVTPSYYESAFCLCELGATWTMTLNSFPLLVPPVDSNNLEGVLHGTQAGMITDAKALDRMRDRVTEALGLKGMSTATWNVKRDQFLRKLPDMLKALAGFKKVDFKDYETMRGNYEAASEELLKATQRIEELERQIEEIGKLKDKKEVSKIRRQGEGESEQFDELVKGAKSLLKDLPNVAKEAVYYRFSGGQLTWPGFGEEAKSDEISRAVDEKYLLDIDGELQVNLGDPGVRRAVDSVDELLSFLKNASEDFHSDFEDENGFQAEVDSKRFWKAFLGLRP
jgi:TIR domain